MEYFSGAVMLRVLHDIRYFTGCKFPPHVQALMISKFANIILARNELRVRELPYTEVLDITKQAMF